MLVVAVATAAHADEGPDFEAAKRHYLAGKQALVRKDYDGAIREYILAYDITKDPSLFRQIGGAYEAEGKTTEAAIYYRRYLAEIKPGTESAEVRAKLAVLEGGPLVQTQPTTTAPAEPPRLPAPEPPALPETQAVETVPVPSAPPSLIEEPGWRRTTAWVFVALTAVGATTGALLATSANAREEDLRQLVDFRDPTTGLPNTYTGATKADYLAKIDEGSNLNTYSAIAFIGAGACAAAATIFFILDATHATPSETVTVAPFYTPGGGGLAAGMEF